MTDEEKSEFINETTEKICDWCASEQPKIKQAIKEGLEKGLVEGRKEVTYMKAEEYDKYLDACRKNIELEKENAELKAQIEKMKADVSNLAEHQGIVYANDIAVMYSKWE